MDELMSTAETLPARPYDREAVELAERPEGLPENFKTVEDLAASYKELQRALHVQGARLREAEQPHDPDALRAELEEHRRLFFAGLREEAERLLALDTRLAVAEEATARAIGEGR